MHIYTPSRQRISIFIVAVLLLLGQFVSSLHHHELNQPSLDTDDCLICLVGNSGTDSLPIATVLTNFEFGISTLFSVFRKTLITSSFITSYKTRAPPKFS